LGYLLVKEKCKIITPITTENSFYDLRVNFADRAYFIEIKKYNFPKMIANFPKILKLKS